MKKFISIVCFLIITTLYQTGFVYAQKGTAVQDTSSAINFIPEEEWDLFGNVSLLELSLKFDMRKYLKYSEDPEYQDAVLLIHAADTSLEKSIRIKPRGMFRRGYCAFPPLKLNVKKADFDNEYLEDQKSFKVVTHCKYSSLYETYLLKEYLIYKLYNQITDLSFKTRLIKMLYIDVPEKKKPKKTFVKYGFIIEHINSVAKRNDLIVIKLENLGQSSMDKDHMALVAMFEFMIGNTDWSTAGLHNLKVLKALDFNKPYPYPIPYDFDYSGMVDTEYAIPIEDLGIESVTERLYRGICLPEEHVLKARDVFIERKDALFKVINDFTYLDKRDKDKMKKYLSSFYEIIEIEKSFKRSILDSCL